MRVLDRNINAWQFGILIFILMFANKMLVLPSLLFEGAKMQGFFIVVFLFGLEMALLGLFFYLKKQYPTESFAQILQYKFKNVGKVIFYTLFLVFFLSKAVLLYNVTYIFFRNMIYKDTSNFLILFCFLPIINHLAISGLRVMGRTAQLFFPVMLLIVTFCIVVGFFGINSTVIWFDVPFIKILGTLLRHIAPFGDMLFIFIIMDKVVIKKGQWKIVFSLTGTAAVFVILINLIYMLSYTYTSFMHPYAIFEIMSFVREYGGLGRIDIISMIVIILFAYFHLAIYLKSFMLCFEQVFPKLNCIYSLVTFNFIFVIIVIFFIINLETTVVFGEQILPYVIVIPYLLLPIIAVTCLFKKRKKEGK